MDRKGCDEREGTLIRVISRGWTKNNIFFRARGVKLLLFEEKKIPGKQRVKKYTSARLADDGGKKKRDEKREEWCSSRAWMIRLDAAIFIMNDPAVGGDFCYAREKNYIRGCAIVHMLL